MKKSGKNLLRRAGFVALVSRAILAITVIDLKKRLRKNYAQIALTNYKRNMLF